jgi:hypothetical protein
MSGYEYGALSRSADCSVGILAFDMNWRGRHAMLRLLCKRPKIGNKVIKTSYDLPRKDTLLAAVQSPSKNAMGILSCPAPHCGG